MGDVKFKKGDKIVLADSVLDFFYPMRYVNGCLTVADLVVAQEEDFVTLEETLGLHPTRLFKLQSLAPSDVVDRLHRSGERVEIEIVHITEENLDQMVASSLESKKLDLGFLHGTFARDPGGTLPNEIVAFRHWKDAQDAGFVPDGRHLFYGYLHAWWPGRPIDSLRGMQFARVTISGHLAEQAHRRRDLEALRLVEVLRVGLRLEPRLWVEV